MIKYLYYNVLISEIPDELSLGFSITGCPVKCPECHSKYLWDNIGNNLTVSKYSSIIKSQYGITCVLFLGGEWHLSNLIKLLTIARNKFNLKTALYSGQNLEYFLNNNNLLSKLDYLKVGPYKSKYGNLRNKKTNQKLYTLKNGKIEKDITNLFWR